MRFLKYFQFSLVFFISFSMGAQSQENTPTLIKSMQSGGHILMIRHAIAPGYGDPENFKIGDCITQRNLGDQGRKQSAKIGEWLRSHNIKPSAIYSSQWCRCMDTARLLDLGKVQEFSALNSFYEMPENREPSLSILKQFIAKQMPDNDLIIMVTHHVTISAISGQNVSSGNGVLLKLNKSAPYEFVSTITPILNK